MEKVYESPYCLIWADKERCLIETVRTPDTEVISEEEYKADVLEWSRIVQEYCPKFQLVDERNFHFVLEPSLQQWLNVSLVGPAIRAGMQKVAFVVTSDIFAQISIEQAMEEASGSPLEIRYFEDYDEARNWLCPVRMN